MNIAVTTRVLGSHQLKAKRHAAELLLSTGLDEGKVASGVVTQRNIDLLRSWGVDPDDARRFHETYVVAYLAGEIVGASRYFPDLNWAVQAIKSGSRPSDITMIATRPRLSHLAVVPDPAGSRDRHITAQSHRG